MKQSAGSQTLILEPAGIVAWWQVVAAARAWCEGSYCWVVRGNHDDAALAAGMYVARGGSQNELKAKFNWVTELLPEVSSDTSAP